MKPFEVTHEIVNMVKVLKSFYKSKYLNILLRLEDELILTAKFVFVYLFSTNEPPHGKTNNLHRRKQRRRSASR